MTQEERTAWDMYASAYIAKGYSQYHDVARYADEMLAERRKRFCPLCEGTGYKMIEFDGRRGPNKDWPCDCGTKQ